MICQTFRADLIYTSSRIFWLNSTTMQSDFEVDENNFVSTSWHLSDSIITPVSEGFWLQKNSGERYMAFKLILQVDANSWRKRCYWFTWQICERARGVRKNCRKLGVSHCIVYMRWRWNDPIGCLSNLWYQGSDFYSDRSWLTPYEKGISKINKLGCDLKQSTTRYGCHRYVRAFEDGISWLTLHCRHLFI